MPLQHLTTKGQIDNQKEQDDICFFAQTLYRNQMRRFGIKLDDRRRHMYVIGKTGMGKTTMLENMVLHDIYAGHGVGVVDPHGDFAEKIITLAKKAATVEAASKKLHFRRLALAKVRNVEAIKKLFDENVQQFLTRLGGYTRIYKLMPRIGDAAPQALIQYVEAPSEEKVSGTRKRKKKASTAKKTTSRKHASSKDEAAEAGNVAVAENATAGSEGSEAKNP